MHSVILPSSPGVGIHFSSHGSAAVHVLFLDQTQPFMVGRRFLTTFLQLMRWFRSANAPHAQRTIYSREPAASMLNLAMAL